MVDGLIDSVMLGVQFLVQHGGFTEGFKEGFKEGATSGFLKFLFIGGVVLLINLLFKNMQTLRMLLLMGLLTFILSQSINYQFYQANPKFIPLLIFGGIFMFWVVFGGSKES